MLCWVLFPFLSSDLPPNFTYSNQAAISTFYCISSSVLTCIGLSSLITGQLDLKDFLYSPVVGGVMVGSSAGYISNSGGAILLGVAAGVFHVLLQRWEGKIKWYFLI
jgi:ammonia channel protein AmtB